MTALGAALLFSLCTLCLAAAEAKAVASPAADSTTGGGASPSSLLHVRSSLRMQRPITFHGSLRSNGGRAEQPLSHSSSYSDDCRAAASPEATEADDYFPSFAARRNAFFTAASREMISFVFSEYKRIAYPHSDEARPNTCAARNNTLLGDGVFLATLIDSLDTLAMVGATATTSTHTSSSSSSSSSFLTSSDSVRQSEQPPPAAAHAYTSGGAAMHRAFWDSVSFICSNVSARVFGVDKRDVGQQGGSTTTSPSASFTEDDDDSSNIEVTYVSPRRTQSAFGRHCGSNAADDAGLEGDVAHRYRACGCPYSDPLRRAPKIDARLNGFETNIRIIGGLLAGHFMIEEGIVPPIIETETKKEIQEADGEGKSGGKMMKKKISVFHYDGCLLRLALAIGRQFLPIFDTPTGIPYGTFNLKSGVKKGEIEETSVSEAGTYLLEFTILSRASGDPRFERVAKRAARAIFRRRHPVTGLLGTHINVTSGAWTIVDSTVGSGVDSYLEYLVKQFSLTGEKEFLLMFNVLHRGIYNFLRIGSGDENDDLAELLAPAEGARLHLVAKKEQGNAESKEEDAIAGETPLEQSLRERPNSPINPLQRRPVTFYQSMPMTGSGQHFPLEPNGIGTMGEMELRGPEGAIVADPLAKNTLGLRANKKAFGTYEHGSLCNFYPGLLALAGHMEEAKAAIHSQQRVWDALGAFPESFDVQIGIRDGVVPLTMHGAAGAGRTKGLPPTHAPPYSSHVMATAPYWHRMAKEAAAARARAAATEETLLRSPFSSLPKTASKEEDVQFSHHPTASPAEGGGGDNDAPQQSQTADGNYPLRPEHIESLYVLHEATRDDAFAEMASRVLTALEARTRGRCGYTSLRDVAVLTPPRVLRERLESDAFAGTALPPLPSPKDSSSHSDATAAGGTVPTAKLLLSDSLMPHSLWRTFYPGAINEETKKREEGGSSASPAAPNSNHLDHQESFIISETLKYAFLIFSQAERERQADVWIEFILSNSKKGVGSNHVGAIGDLPSDAALRRPRPFVQNGNVESAALFREWQQRTLAKCKAIEREAAAAERKENQKDVRSPKQREEALGSGANATAAGAKAKVIEAASILCASVKARRYSLSWVFSTEGHPYPARPEWSNTYALSDSSSRYWHWTRCCPAKAAGPFAGLKRTSVGNKHGEASQTANDDDVPLPLALPFLSSMADNALDAAHSAAFDLVLRRQRGAARVEEKRMKAKDEGEEEESDSNIKKKQLSGKAYADALQKMEQSRRKAETESPSQAAKRRAMLSYGSSSAASDGGGGDESDDARSPANVRGHYRPAVVPQAFSDEIYGSCHPSYGKGGNNNKRNDRQRKPPQLYMRGVGDLIEALEPVHPYTDAALTFEAQGRATPPRHIRSVSRLPIDLEDVVLKRFVALMEADLERQRRAVSAAERALERATATVVVVEDSDDSDTRKRKKKGDDLKAKEEQKEGKNAEDEEETLYRAAAANQRLLYAKAYEETMLALEHELYGSREGLPPFKSAADTRRAIEERHGGVAAIAFDSPTYDATAVRAKSRHFGPRYDNAVRTLFFVGVREQMAAEAEIKFLKEQRRRKRRGESLFSPSVVAEHRKGIRARYIDRARPFEPKPRIHVQGTVFGGPGGVMDGEPPHPYAGAPLFVALATAADVELLERASPHRGEMPHLRSETTGISTPFAELRLSEEDPTPLRCPAPKGIAGRRHLFTADAVQPPTAEATDEPHHRRAAALLADSWPSETAEGRKAAIAAAKSVARKRRQGLEAQLTMPNVLPPPGTPMADEADGGGFADDDSYFEAQVGSEYLLMPTARSFLDV